MATPPPPDVNTIRVRLAYDAGTSHQGGNRLYFSFTGARPSAAELNTFAAAVATSWNTNCAPLINTLWTLSEVDVLDITDATGFSGFATPADAGSRSGTAVANAMCVGIESNIQFRYRGGKPRIYWPPGITTDEAAGAPVAWSTTFIGLWETGMAAFIAGVTSSGWSGAGTLAHIMLSYYDGVDKQQPPAGRWRGPGYKYPPLYRTGNAKSYPVTGYAVKATMASQKRRRTATTP